MWKRALVLVGLATLGCSGIAEKAVELSTGGTMEIAENGDVTMVMADGTKVLTQQGASPPEGFPLPPPYEGAVPQALVTTMPPSGPPQWILSYEMKAPREEIAKTYLDWLESQGVKPKHQKETVAGIVTESVIGELEGGAAVISLTEAYGANTISVIWAPGGLDSIIK